MELDYVSLGKRIREKRQEKHWTQEYLGEIAVVEPSNLSHIERAATKVGLPTLLRIANALGTTLDELIYDSLSKNAYITTRKIAALLEDCTDEELHLMAEMLTTFKSVLRHHNRNEE